MTTLARELSVHARSWSGSVIGGFISVLTPTHSSLAEQNKPGIPDGVWACGLSQSGVRNMRTYPDTSGSILSTPRANFAAELTLNGHTTKDLFYLWNRPWKCIRVKS